MAVRLCEMCHFSPESPHGLEPERHAALRLDPTLGVSSPGFFRTSGTTTGFSSAGLGQFSGDLGEKWAVSA